MKLNWLSAALFLTVSVRSPGYVIPQAEVEFEAGDNDAWFLKDNAGNPTEQLWQMLGRVNRHLQTFSSRRIRGERLFIEISHRTLLMIPKRL